MSIDKNENKPVLFSDLGILIVLIIISIFKGIIFINVTGNRDFYFSGIDIVLSLLALTIFFALIKFKYFSWKDLGFVKRI